MLKAGLLLLLLRLLPISSSPANSYTVSTLINAKWKQTPLYMEISEYMADENLFWDFLNSINKLEKSLRDYGTDSQQYLTALRIARLHLSESQMPLLKLIVSMHSLTPRIQAHFEVASETLNDVACQKTFAVIGQEVICSPNDLNTAIKNAPKNPEHDKVVELYSYDHIYPGSENNSLTVVLYGDIGTQDFFTYHDKLVAKVFDNNIRYVVRHYLHKISSEPVRLSNYGVELHLKSTEYKSQDDAPKASEGNMQEEMVDQAEVLGVNFKVLQSRFPTLSHSLDQLKQSLLHSDDEIPQLKAWEFQELGLKAASNVAEIKGDEALQILQYTAQNFPTYSKTIRSKSVSEDLRKEIKHNIQAFSKNLNIAPPDGSLFVNGLFYDADTMDMENLFQTIRTDMRVLEIFYNNSIKDNIASALLSIDLSKTVDQDFAIDIRDAAIMWINNMESDQQYFRWPGSVTDLLRPTFPGMLRNIRKNIFNLVLVFDPLQPKMRELVNLCENFVTHMAPLRVGLIFDVRKTTPTNLADYRAIFCAFNYITQKHNARKAINFVVDVLTSAKSQDTVRAKDIQKRLKKLYPSVSNADLEYIFDEDSEYDFGRELSSEFLDRLGYKDSPIALLNGVPMPQNLLDSESDFEEAVFSEIIKQTSIFQKAVYRGDLTDSDSVIDYLMRQAHVMPRLNQRILSDGKDNYLEMNGSPSNDLSNVIQLGQLSNEAMTATLIENLKYFHSKGGKELYYITIWIFTDLNTVEGKNLLKNALLYLKSNSNARLAFIPNTEGTEVHTKNDLNKLVWSLLQAERESGKVDLVLKWLGNSDDISEIPEYVNEILPSSILHIKMLRVYAQRVLRLRKSESAVVANGKIYGPLTSEEQFGTDDFNLIEHLINMQYVDKVQSILKNNSKDNKSSTIISSNTLLKIYGCLISRESKPRYKIPTEVKDSFSVIKLQPKNDDAPYFDIVAVIDPASKAAQRLSPILVLLRNLLNCQMRVFLTPLDQHSDMPVKNFYRYVLEPEVQFDYNGKLAEEKVIAKFNKLPLNALLTQNLHVPENWMVEVVRSVYDLDNIKLSEIGGPVHSEYELEFLLLEGHCFDTNTGAPPRGLQITLGKKNQPAVVDTIVMANLGYFQLKANPGVWELNLREGRSADIYDIISVEGRNTISNGKAKIVISSLQSHVVKLRVSKKPDKQSEDLLADVDDNGSNSGIWNSIANSITGSVSNTESDDGTINIFSVASGHLYERLLRIMMVSLLKHTKSPVKFWFLKNYLSPQFTDFLPHMAREYKFEFELVQYKWPRWLHQQTEKQRTIWGYKILFLDVLFPLNVKKIIFVDADAIVRADVKELFEMDLDNAPYAYTPFCDSRKEMEGFRFWKQGYWRSHLAGRRYHISALYVVDLKRFRKIAAGDRLRGQYQALSQDPNSLSNLDQDLPNNMIHQVAMKSLPQDWLWCETWCNDSSFKTAKVIDLCNNPQTKEAKLAAAQRIVPEWKDYDEEIKRLMRKIEDSENIEHHEHEKKLLNTTIATENKKHEEL